MAASSHAELNIDHHRAAELRLWWQTEGGTAALSSMSGAGGSGRNDPLRTIAAIKEEDLGGKEKADYIKVRARIFHIPHEKNLYYQVLPRLLRSPARRPKPDVMPPLVRLRCAPLNEALTGLPREKLQQEGH